MRGGAAELTVGGVAALQATDGAGLVVGEMDSRAADGAFVFALASNAAAIVLP